MRDRADVERPTDVTGFIVRTEHRVAPEWPEAKARARSPSYAREERKGEPSPLVEGLVELEKEREQKHLHALIAEEVLEVRVEGDQRERRPDRGRAVIEDKRKDRQLSRVWPFSLRRIATQVRTEPEEAD